MAPRQVRLEQIDRAERLLERINLKGSYRYPDICYHVTSYRAEMYPQLVLSGAEAAHDLRLLVERPVRQCRSLGRQFWRAGDDRQ